MSNAYTVRNRYPKFTNIFYINLDLLKSSPLTSIMLS